MFNIDSFLEKFKNLTPPHKEVRRVVVLVVKKNTNIQLEEEQILSHGNTVYLKIKPIYKTEIFLNKKKILEEIKDVLGLKAPQDIR